MTKQGCKAAIGVLLSVACLIPRSVAAQGGTTASRWIAPVIKDTGALRGPRQPIFFRHDVHAGQDKIPCLYCHYSATVSSEPGIPALQTCIGCHQVISGTRRRSKKFATPGPTGTRRNGFASTPTRTSYTSRINDTSRPSAPRRASPVTGRWRRCRRSIRCRRCAWGGASGVTWSTR